MQAATSYRAHAASTGLRSPLHHGGSPYVMHDQDHRDSMAMASGSGSHRDVADMAGIGARRMAQREAARQQRTEQLRWEAEQRQQQQIQYQQSQQYSQPRWNPSRRPSAPEAERRPRLDDGRPRGDSLHLRDVRDGRETQRNPVRREGGPSAHHNDMRSQSEASDQAWQMPSPRHNHRREQTDSQLTARQHHYTRVEETTNMVSDGFGGLMLHIPVPTQQQRTSQVSSAARQTIYEDDYEESAHGNSSRESDTAWRKPLPSPNSLLSAPSATQASSHGASPRLTMLEPLPKATCADCGAQLPFEELVDHECVRDAALSPMVSRALDSSSPSIVQPQSVDASPIKSTVPLPRSPFFDRYDRLHESSTSHSGLLSPGSGTKNAASPSLSPYMASEDTTVPPRSSPRCHPSPLARSETLSGGEEEDVKAEQERQRLREERKRQIEAQRAAKKEAIRTAQASPQPAHPIGTGAVSHDGRFHRRAAESHSSSASSVSTKSSASSFFARTGAANLTPSSSVEQVSQFGTALSKIPPPSPSFAKLSPSPSTKKAALDLGDIEGLVRDIENAPASPTLPVPQQRGKRSDLQRNQRTAKAVPSSSTKSSPPVTRPVVSRTRTRDQAQERLCSVCLQAFRRGQPMLQRDGKVFCVEDYAQLYLEPCRKCRQPVQSVGIRSRDGALTGLFHKECFSCLACDATFKDGTFYIYDNAPYCGPDYHRLNGTLCAGCHTGIEGQCRQLVPNEAETEQHGHAPAVQRFHPHCLTCQFDDGHEFCKEPLQEYYLFNDRRLCQWHFERCARQARQRAAAADALTAKERVRRPQAPPVAGSSGSHLGDHHARGDSDGSEAIARQFRAAKRTTYLRTVAATKGRAG